MNSMLYASGDVQRGESSKTQMPLALVIFNLYCDSLSSVVLLSCAALIVYMQGFHLLFNRDSTAH